LLSKATYKDVYTFFTFTLMAHCTSGAIRGSVSCSRTPRQGIEPETSYLQNDFSTSCTTVVMAYLLVVKTPYTTGFLSSLVGIRKMSSGIEIHTKWIHGHAKTNAHTHTRKKHTKTHTRVRKRSIK